MSEPFLGEVKMFGFPFAPTGWAACDGQVMSIPQNQALFALIGTAYGGNGVSTFNLPDLRGRVAVHMGNAIQRGNAGGEETHTLTITEMPLHQHIVKGSSAPPNQSSPSGNNWAAAPENVFTKQPSDGQLNPAAIGVAGESQGHPNLQPYLAVNYCIALQGIWPSRN